jgi:hypothetical protein
MLAACVAGNNTPMNSGMPDENVAVLAGRRSIYYATSQFKVPAYDITTGNGIKRLSESNRNYSAYFGLSALGIYHTAAYTNGAVTVFSYSQFDPCEWKNDTQPAIVNVEGQNRRRLQDTYTYVTTMDAFDACADSVAGECKFAQKGAYSRFVAAFIFAMLGVPLQVVRAWDKGRFDNHHWLLATTLCWLMVCSLAAAGMNEFYNQCVQPALSYVSETSLTYFNADIEIHYGTLANCALAAAAFSGIVMVINMIFYYETPTMVQRRLTGLDPNASDAPMARRTTVHELTRLPSVAEGKAGSVPSFGGGGGGDQHVRQVDDNFNAGDIYANSGRV